MEALTDNSKMPFGKHKDKPMIKVPAYYLLYIYDNNMCSNQAVKQYIIDNMEALKKEAGKVKR